MVLHCLDILGCTPWWICWVLFEILFGQVGDLGEGRSSHGCASYISPEVFLTQYWYSIHAVLMIWSQDGKVRVLVAGGWSGHNIRTAEVKMPSMQWLYQIRSPRLFFTTICGFQVFNPATERWRVVGDLSSPRRGLSLQVEKYFIYLSWQWPSRLQRVVVWWLWGAGDKYILKDLLNQKYFSFLFSLWNLIRPGISYMQFIYIYLCILC